MQCELAALEWRVYGADTASSLDAGGGHEHTPRDSKQDALHALFLRLQQQRLLTVSETADDNDGEGNAAARVWLFVVNNGSQDFPTADTLGDVIEVASGTWTHSQYPQQQLPLDAALEARLFRALHALLARKLLRHSEFVLEDAFFQPNDAKFVYRSPSLSQLNHFDIYLDEELPCPAFQLHFQLLVPTHLVCVSVTMRMQDSAVVLLNDELGTPHASWQRLLGLPCASDHSMVDVWHLNDSLAPRIIAETRFSDVFPRFRSVTKQKKHKRKSNGDGGDDDANDGDEVKKPEENDDDGEDDDDEAAHDAEGDGDELTRRTTVGKKKRKKVSTDPAENDESVAPVSPDTHVNTPDATGPTVLVTFPHDAVDNVLLHYDAQVSHFKRKRNPPLKTKNDGDLALVFGSATSGMKSSLTAEIGPKRSSATEYTNFVKANAAAGPVLSLLPARRNSLLGSGPATTAPRVEVKPTLSVAVSLVASLSHDEQQEALDGRPSKTHPLLEALQNYVEAEISEDMAERTRRALSTKHRLLPIAEDYDASTGSRKPPVLLGVNTATSERLRNNLLTDRFKNWISDYSPHQFTKQTKQLRKERQRRVLLEFDETRLLEYSHEKAVAQTQNLFQSRDEEIALGVHIAASDALVAWRDVPRVPNRWSQHSKKGTRVATKREKQDLADRVTPHLLALRLFLKKGGHFTESWLSFSEFAKQSKHGDDLVENGGLQPEPPKFCVTTVEAGLHVEPPLISEYLLRGFHPVAAPKPVDYAIVCPHSPSEWLGILALSYLTCFRSMYAQCHMGDHAAIDLALVEATNSVSVDASNALLLVECASSAYDAFATYRAAGELLQPVLSNGVKKKQAFSRSAVANVIYLVVPFRRQDVKHKMWALGAFSRGLFGPTTSFADVTWKGSVTIELLYLEDLFEVGLNPNPFALMPSCFGLYDRVFENVSLKPAEIDLLPAPTALQAGKTRYVSERLYHLAEASSPDENAVPRIYGGYVISEDRKWIACSCADAVGSVLETHMICLDGVTTLEDAFLEMMSKWLHFLALFGEKAMLVICRLSESNDPLDDNELSAWRNLSGNRPEAFVPVQFAPLLADLKIVQVSFMAYDKVQLREDDASMLYGTDTSGYLVVSPNESVGEGSRGASYATGGSCNFGSSCFPRSQRGKEAAVVNVTIVLDQLIPSSESEQGALSTDDVHHILRDFHALSYLTMHPITTERASPLPLHLAAVDKLNQDVSLLAKQLSTDPLQFR